MQAKLLLIDGHNARKALAQYIALAPLSPQKLSCEQTGGKVRHHTACNPCFKHNPSLWSAPDSIAQLTQLIPLWGVRFIHYYVLYSSRCKARWHRRSSHSFGSSGLRRGLLLCRVDPLGLADGIGVLSVDFPASEEPAREECNVVGPGTFFGVVRVEVVTIQDRSARVLRQVREDSPV
jgi:hypothetical protein